MLYIKRFESKERSECVCRERERDKKVHTWQTHHGAAWESIKCVNASCSGCRFPSNSTTACTVSHATASAMITRFRINCFQLVSQFIYTTWISCYLWVNAVGLLISNEATNDCRLQLTETQSVNKGDKRKNKRIYRVCTYTRTHTRINTAASSVIISVAGVCMGG